MATAVKASNVLSIPIDLLRVMLASVAQFQTWTGVAQTISGDTGSQLSSLSLTGETLQNTDNGTLYWNLTQTGGTSKVEIWKDADKASGNLVASGTRTGDGSITLTAQNSSGISGSVTVAYTTDDTDSGNKIVTKTGAALQRTYVDFVQGATEGTQPTRPLAVISDISYNRFRDSVGAYNQFSERGSLLLELQAEVTAAHVTDDGNDAGYDFRNNIGQIINDLDTLSLNSTMLDIASVSYQQHPVRIMPGEAIADKEIFKAILQVDWGRS